MLKFPAFSLPALCFVGSMLGACLTCLSQPQFYTELFGAWCFIPIKGWAAALFLLCCHTILVDYGLMQLSDGALHRVE